MRRILNLLPRSISSLACTGKCYNRSAQPTTREVFARGQLKHCTRFLCYRLKILCAGARSHASSKNSAENWRPIKVGEAQAINPAIVYGPVLADHELLAASKALARFVGVMAWEMAVEAQSGAGGEDLHRTIAVALAAWPAKRRRGQQLN